MGTVAIDLRNRESGCQAPSWRSGTGGRVICAMQCLAVWTMKRENWKREQEAERQAPIVAGRTDHRRGSIAHCDS